MPKLLNKDILDNISAEYGDAFYLLESDAFKANYVELKKCFESYYHKFNIAYSYKTNYIPKLVKIVDDLGGYAEVVSGMEMSIALKSGVKPEHIIWNGPVKDEGQVRKLLLSGGMVNIDSVYETDLIRSIAIDNPDKIINIGIRLNYDVGDGVLSRFGIDVNDKDFDIVLRFVTSIPNVRLKSLQAHYAKRDPKFWPARVEGMLEVYDRVVNDYGQRPKILDIGGGMYGKMPDDLRSQLGIGMIGYDAYASVAGKAFADHFAETADSPYLFIEPGSAIAGDGMRFVCRVKTVKSVRGKYIATVTGSQKNISMQGINPPMTVIPGKEEEVWYDDIDIAGFTCIEGDILYRNYSGKLSVGDYVVFDNCGSYSIVMKPPFIMPNFPVLDICGDGIGLIKRAETFEDLFLTYYF